MARVDRKHREFEHRGEDILDAALTLFSEPNWESVTIEDIAAAADVGKGTVYKHVASKDELLFRLMMRFYDGLLVHLQRELAGDGDELDRFRRLFVSALRYHVEHREFRYIVEYCKRIDFKERADETWRATFLELDQGFKAWGDPMFEHAMETGLIEKRPLEQLSVGMCACFDGAVEMLWAGNDWCAHGDEQQIIDAVTAFLMAALIGQR